MNEGKELVVTTVITERYPAEFLKGALEDPEVQRRIGKAKAEGILTGDETPEELFAMETKDSVTKRLGLSGISAIIFNVKVETTMAYE